MRGLEEGCAQLINHGVTKQHNGIFVEIDKTDSASTELLHVFYNLDILQ